MTSPSFIIDLLLGTVVSCSAGTGPVSAGTPRTYLVDFVGAEGMFRTRIGKSAWPMLSAPAFVLPMPPRTGVIGVRLGGVGGPIAPFYVEAPYVRGCENAAPSIAGFDLARMLELAAEAGEERKGRQK